MCREDSLCPKELQLCGREGFWISKLLRVCQQGAAGACQTTKRHEKMCEITERVKARAGKVQSAEKTMLQKKVQQFIRV